jgi:hypothetical protein
MYSKLDELGYGDKDFGLIYQYILNGYSLPKK